MECGCSIGPGGWGLDAVCNVAHGEAAMHVTLDLGCTERSAWATLPRGAARGSRPVAWPIQNGQHIGLDSATLG